MAKTLLLADDSVVIQKLVGLSFANEDIELITTDNGDDALVRAREARPDLVLADVVMPGKNGYELCEALKADAALHDVPVLLLTGTFEAFDEARAQEVGADGHITKPFEAQVLVDRVNELLAKSSAAAPTTASADSAYDFFDQSSSELAPEAPHAAPGLPPSDVLAASGLSAEDSFSFGESDAVTGSDQTIALMPETPAKGNPAASSSSPEGPLADSLAIASPGDFGSDALEVDLLDDDSFESQQTSPLGAAAVDDTPPLAQTMLADEFTSEASTSPRTSSDDAFDFSFGGAADAPPTLSRPGVSDPGLSASGAPPSVIPEPPDAPREARAEPPTAHDSPASAAPEISVGAHDAEPLVALEDLEELSGSEAAVEVEVVAGAAAAVPVLEATPIDALPELDAAQMAEIDERGDAVGRDTRNNLRPDPPAPAANRPEVPSPPAPTALASAPEWVTEAVSPAESQNPPPSMRATEQVLAPDDAASPRADANNAPSGANEANGVVDGAMRDRVHDAVEKIAWEAFADLSETLVRQLVERVEAIAWEVIPQMTEALIKEEIRRLKGDPDA